MKLNHDASEVPAKAMSSYADAFADDIGVRYGTKRISEIFAGPYFATISPDGTVAVTIRMGKRGGWLELRRR